MDKKVVTLFNNPLSRSGTPSRTSLNISLNKSRQSIKPVPSVHIIIKSANNMVERCGLPIPVLVEEAFAFSDRNVAITARVSECGYAWVVCGRKLFIWQFQLKSTHECMKHMKFPICYELRLPPSDLAHRAELVTVIINKKSQEKSSHPSCVAVSPEGMVRYWPDISQQHLSVDKNVALNGEECDSLIDAGSLGCIFVTTTCTVVLIQYKRGTYRGELNCHPLKTPRSWIGGVSRRVSSIFFGPISSDHGNEPKTVRLLAIPGIQSSYSIYVLAGLNLQKWSISDQNVEQLSWSTDLSRAVKDSFRSQVPHWEVCDPDIDMWILDMQPDREGVLLLCAAVNLRTSPQVYYGMTSFAVNLPNPPVEPRDFLLLKMMGLYRENHSAEVLNYKFFVCETTAYIYSTKSITVVNPMEDPDRLEFLHPTDHIFGGCSCRNIPVFFSRKHGLVVVNGRGEGDRSFDRGGSSSFADISLLDQNITTNNLSLYRMDPHEIYSAHRDTDAQLKAAFIFHVKNQLNDCYSLVNKLFPMDVPTLPSFDGPLDVTIVKIAKDILDDIPAGDIRWSTPADGSIKGLGSSNSMLVNQQLIDKQLAYSLFLKFLKESGLWNKLSGLTVRNSHTSTIIFLSELGEKIVAALTLKNAPLSLILENTIAMTVKKYSTKVEGGLSKHDVFYREITRVHEGFLWLTKLCEECSHSTTDPAIISGNIHEANQLILSVLSEVLHYRKQSADVFCLNEISISMDLEYLPWTAAGGPEGIMDVLMLQHSLTLNYGLKVIQGTKPRELLLEEFVLLTDIIMDGRKAHLATVKSRHEKVLYKQYCTDRHKLIRPLIDINAPTEALMLAEKYLDFEILMRICEATNNEDRINEYMRRFKDTDFAEFVYNWYMREGKQSKLLIRYCKTDNLPEGRERLSRFLAAYPTLSWIQHISDKDFSKSADILLQLGENESQYVGRQKSMFSISKLARLASKDPINPSEHLETINKYLELISYQEQIPDYVVQHHGFNSKKPKVLHPREIITLYISTEYVDAKELEFRKALDVASFIDSIEKVELILQIWRAALLRDTWQFASLDQPLDCLQNTMFFRLIDLSMNLGYDASTLLPPIDMLLDDSSLDGLRQNPNFEPLLKTGYEQFHRLQML